ncbi:velvet factor-domain-containing protein [Cadophora sp. MPI-SDFR-AT-0126]|nr:velvet factor-domain-containing protein [Leotiomycetes sp. MPI-SDFR-AT-0126]
MATVQSTHQFAEAMTSQIQGLSSHDCELVIRQGPENARVAIGKEKDRKPVDPPPIIQLKISSQVDVAQNYLQSPYFFMSCSLLPESDLAQLPTATGSLGSTLAGTLVSSLHRLKDTDNYDGAFFVFGDLSVKHEGRFRLQFTLYEMRQHECAYIKSITSDPFPVHSTKNFQGMSESTFLTRSFSDQGVRLRLRKEPRTLLRKRGPAHDDYEPRHYRQGNRQQSTGGDRHSQAPAESQEPPRRDHNDQGDYTEAQSSWGQRPTPTRHYSQHSATSFPDSTAGSYDDYQTLKRPRTGSEQSQSSSAFGAQVHPSPLNTTAFVSRPFPESQQPGFNQYTSAQPPAYGSYTYTQSPQSATSSRPSYFPDRVGPQAGSTGTSSPFDSSLARSPLDGQFPPQQQALRYNTQLPFEIAQPMSLAPRLDSIQQISLGPMPSGYPATNYGMPPPIARMSNNPVYPSFSAAPVIGRRESYQAYSSSGPNPNMSAGNNIGSGLYSQG